MKFRAVLVAFVAIAIAASFVATSADPALALHGRERIVGKVTDAATGTPLDNVCVVLGPSAARCWTATNALGDYVIDLGAIAPPGFSTPVQFFRTGYASLSRNVAVNNDADTVLNVAMTRNDGGSGAPPPATPPPNLVQPTPTPIPVCSALDSRLASTSVYLPNITKTLGGPDGFQTPFIVQNIGAANTDLEVSFYRFSDGACIVRLTRAALRPGTSQAFSPNAIAALPGDSQFSVVVRSFGAQIVSVVNQHQNTQDPARSEALSYNGFSAGAGTVYLPNIVRRFFGYVTPFIIQNLGPLTASVTARFVSFDGTAPVVQVSRVIDSGRSKFVDPNSNDPTLGAPGLMDGKQYAVTVTSTQPLAVVVNTHNDAPGTAHPVAYSANGLTLGAPLVYAPYAARNAAGIGRLSTIVVQNLGASAVRPTLTFQRHNTTTTQTFTAPADIAPGASWAFDPRFHLGTITPCSAQSATCLADGEYSLNASAPGGSIAAVVNVISPETAMGYSAVPQPAARFFLPNVTRTLGGSAGWSTPIFLQSAGASAAVLSWYRFSDGVLVHTQNVSIPSSGGVKVDPRDVPQLGDDTQYSVVVAGTGGNVVAIVMQLASGADNAMIYEGFAAP